MVSAADTLGVIALSYFSSGNSMVQYQSRLDPIDQPAYLRGPAVQRLVAGCLWPLTAKATGDLAWNLTCFVGTVAVFGLYYGVLGNWIASTILRLVVIGTLSVAPFLGTVLLNGPRGITSAILWVFMVKPLGGRRPPLQRPRLSKKNQA